MKINKLVLALLATGLVTGAQAADADRLKALEAQLKVMKKEIADLNEQMVLQGKEAVVQGDLPMSFRVPGSETSLHIYGYGEMNLIHDAASSVAGDFFSYTQYQPLRGTNPSKNNTRMTVQTSRLGFETTTPTSIGPFNTKIEADFFGNAAGPGSDTNGLSNNSALLRLRHAYGEYAGFLIGQTWSTFMDADNVPETVDFNGANGATFSRPVQVRYTYNLPDVAKLQFAIENPTSGSSSLTNARAKSPSLVLRADKAFMNGAMLSLRAIRHKEIDQASGASATGNGLGVSGSYKLTEDLTGFGQYTQADSDSWTSLVVGSNGTAMVGSGLQMDRTRGVVLGLTNVFNLKWRASVAYGRTESQWASTSAYVTAVGTDVANKRVEQLHLNVFYTPVKNVNLGAEFIRGLRTTFDNQYGDMNRINLQARYSFN